jgi:sec-independent protein translocase protein TatB
LTQRLGVTSSGDKPNVPKATPPDREVVVERRNGATLGGAERMFDLDVGKLLIVGAVALIVVGPKDLPRVLRTVGQVVGKARRVARDVQNQFTEALNEADLDRVKKELRTINESATIDISVNPATAMRGHLTAAVEGAENGAPSSGHSKVAAEEAYASPEMKEYLAMSLEPSADAPGVEPVAKGEIASADIDSVVDKGAKA